MRFDEEKTNNFEKESPLQTFKDRNITPEKALPFDIHDPSVLQYWSSQLVSISSKGTALYQIRAKQQRRLREAGKMVNKSLIPVIINQIRYQFIIKGNF